MELILFFAFIAWLCWLCDRSDLVDAGKAAYQDYCRYSWHANAGCPSWFERHLEQREAILDQETQSFQKYLAEHPTPPKVPQ